MNYLKQYIKLIRKAQFRKEISCFESHHVFPKSVYGANKYIVKLSPREHYIAHALLYKAFIKRYGRNNPKSIKMMYAFRCMHTKNPAQAERYSNSKLYEKLRIEFQNSISGENAPFFGKKHSDKTKRKQSKSKLGKNHPLFGIFGENHPSFGRTHSAESIEKMREIKLGEKNPMYGKNHTESVLNKLKEANIGKNNPSYGKRWFNDGKYNVLAFECPDGFKLGRLMGHVNKIKQNVYKN